LYEELKTRIFSLTGEPGDFEGLALELFGYQYQFNPLYRQFCDSLKKIPGKVTRLEHIPFLPIEFFKTSEVLTASPLPATGSRVFRSSGTTGQTQSRHVVADVSVYETAFNLGFQLFYGLPEDFSFWALLPSYEENPDSSLICMVNGLVKRSGKKHSRFWQDTRAFRTLLASHDIATHLHKDAKEKNILLGVTYALLDLVEKQKFSLRNTIIMETGGMKGRRKEMVREELHEKLCEGFGVSEIHSEYGMTELLSQAYSAGKGIFHCPPWMRIMIRDTEDPFRYLEHERTGGINVIDLANINSCCFIATQDLGKTHEENSFEVLGRFDNSDIRGCNLLVQ
jgi:hypothetical protein